MAGDALYPAMGVMGLYSVTSFGLGPGAICIGRNGAAFRVDDALPAVVFAMLAVPNNGLEFALTVETAGGDG